MVVVDKNMKLAHFIPTIEANNISNGTPSLYLHHVWKHHGIPDEVISDCGLVFVSKFMNKLGKLLQI